MAGEFDLHQLLAGPIIAMNDAQADAAASFYEVFDQFAFEPAQQAAHGAEPEPRRLRMISFIAERATADGIERRQISMPLLQMIPIGGIGIDSAKIQFSLAVNAEPPSAARAPANAPAAAERAVALKARIAPAAASETASGNLQVEIVLKQLDLPAGYLDMIAETQGGISRRVSGEPASPTGPSDEPAENQELFQARFGEPPDRIAPGREIGFAIEIDVNPRFVGPDGMELKVETSLKNKLRVGGPAPPARLAPGRHRLRVTLVAAANLPAGDAALVLNGTSTGPDGVKSQHAVRLALVCNDKEPPRP